MRFVLGIAAAAAILPAAAQAQDAFTTFNGTQGAGNFSYGELNPSGTSGSFFSANTNCFITGSQCLQRAANGTVPGFTKGGSPAFQSNSVNVPQDRLLVHPGQDDLLTSAIFVAPTPGVYNYRATFNVQDINPSGVSINFLRATNGALPYVITSIGSLSANNTIFTTSGSVTLTQSDSFGFGIGRAGTFNNDSTGFNFSVAAVPEPATWGMMILGFGAMGVAMRRRAKVRTNVSFA